MNLAPRRPFPAFFLLLVTASGLTGCGSKFGQEKAPMLANPASVYCKEQGGQLEIRKEKGGEVGYCHLAYGRIVEEWVLYRAAHHQTAPR